jgi:hypothetical protein
MNIIIRVAGTVVALDRASSQGFETTMRAVFVLLRRTDSRLTWRT